MSVSAAKGLTAEVWRITQNAVESAARDDVREFEKPMEEAPFTGGRNSQ